MVDAAGQKVPKSQVGQVAELALARAEFAGAIGLPAEPDSVLRGLLPSEPGRLAGLGLDGEHHAAPGELAEALVPLRVEEHRHELDAVLEQVQPSQVVYIQADCVVQDVKLFERGDRIKEHQLNFKGRGGTAFAPAFKYLFEEHPDVQAVVYLTDLESNDFNEAEKYVTCPVLWVSVNPRAVAPFGTTVYMPPV